MKTQITYYKYNTDKPEEMKAYLAMVAVINSTVGRGRWHNAISHDRIRLPKTGNTETVPIELETEHLYDNQWNSDLGRVFDWFEMARFDYRGNKVENIKTGHFLTVTPEMADIRENTLACGYTGRQVSRQDFAVGSLNMEGLSAFGITENELHLLRFLPVSVSFNGKRAPLTDEEKAILIPKMYDARCRKGQEKFDEDIREEQEKLAKKTKEMEDHIACLKWLKEHGFTSDIYYREGVCRFGLMEKFSPGCAEYLRNELQKQGFPFKFEISTK